MVLVNSTRLAVEYGQQFRVIDRPKYVREFHFRLIWFDLSDSVMFARRVIQHRSFETDDEHSFGWIIVS
jgi:hypothetical protein